VSTAVDRNEQRLRRQRDAAVAAADRLTTAVARLFDMNFGERTGMNDPWLAALAALQKAAAADLRGRDRHQVHAETEQLLVALAEEWQGPGPRAPHVVAHLFTELGRVTFQLRGYPTQLAFLLEALRAYNGPGTGRAAAARLDRPVHVPGSGGRYAETPPRGPGSVYRQDD
jgi:hypothetical protein